MVDASKSAVVLAAALLLCPLLAGPVRGQEGRAGGAGADAQRRVVVDGEGRIVGRSEPLNGREGRRVTDPYGRTLGTVEPRVDGSLRWSDRYGRPGNPLGFGAETRPDRR